MRLLFLYSIFLGSIILGGCCLGGRSELTMNPSISEYVTPFKTGNWWVYQNATNGNVDSFWVSNTTQTRYDVFNKCQYYNVSEIILTSSRGLSFTLFIGSVYFYGENPYLKVNANTILEAHQTDAFEGQITKCSNLGNDTIAYMKKNLGIESFKINSDSFHIIRYKII